MCQVCAQLANYTKYGTLLQVQTQHLHMLGHTYKMSTVYRGHFKKKKIIVFDSGQYDTIKMIDHYTKTCINKYK